uniref:Methylated-DNA--protein-cysteine methyltransferase n=1 Tax=Equus caballus TaxID=9796 RepID=A0A9L0S8M2_HORSE
MPGLPALLRCSASLRSQLLAVGALGNAVPGRMDKVCDMKYKMMDSPLGKIELSGCEQGLHGIKLHGRKGADTDPVEAPAPPELLGGPEDVAEPLMQCAAWLDAYFHKPALLTELPLPALHHPVFQQDSFTRQVLWKLLKVVKFGEMISYQQLAALAGNPKAARAVGGAMRNNPETEEEKTQTLRRRAHVKMEMEIGVLRPQAKEAWSHQKLEKSSKDSLPQSLWREHGAANALISDFWPPEP